MPNVGDTLYNHDDGTAITLQRGSDGVLKWSDPVKLPPAQSGKMAPPPGPDVGIGEDMAKTAGPAIERGLVGGATSIPTLSSSLASGVGSLAGNYLPEKVGGPIQKGAQAYSDFLKPFTYPQVQGKIESAYNQTHPNAPFYYPQTTAGQFEESGIQGGLAAAGGPASMVRALGLPLAKLGGRLATGVGAGLGSEAAKQGTEAAGFDSLAPYAGAAGAYIGGREAAERPRKTITPNPAISQAHTDMAKLLEKQPGDITTAGQATGNPKLLQKDANLAPYAKAPYNNLSTTQPLADTRTLLGTTGLKPSDTQAGASRPLIQQSQREIGARRDTLEANTKMAYDPQFQQEMKDTQNEYHRVSNTSPDPANPSPVEKRIQQIYQSGPKSRRMGLFGGDTTDNNGNTVQGYSSIRSDISKEAKSYTNKDPVAASALAKIRDSLDGAMERSQAGTPYEGKWAENNQQYESAKVLERSTKQRAPAAGLLEPNTVNSMSRDPDAQIAQLARAQATVHKPLPPPNEPSGLIPTMAGALMSHLTGSSSPEEGAIAGSVSGPTIAKSLTRNPVTAGIHFSPWNQARQKNQLWPPGPGSTMDPATVARLLAIQNTANKPPDPE